MLRRSVCLLGLVMCVSALPVFGADAQADRLRQAVRSAQDAARKAEQGRAVLQKERDELQAANARLTERDKANTADLDDLRRELGATRAKSVALLRELDAARKQNQALEQDLRLRTGAIDAARARLVTLDAKAQQLQSELGVRGREKEQLSSQVERVTKEIAACERDNAGFYQVSIELAEKSTGLSYWDGVMRREPLLQFSRVELENLMERYRDRIEQQRRRSDSTGPGP